MYYKLPNAHQPMQFFLPTGGQFPLGNMAGLAFLNPPVINSVLFIRRNCLW